ncbi:MAG: periplasmic heavy metal sensor [Cytophagales bacterium]|nr:periplasmic heavy metal sensor [Cytophagales bacterium]
MSKQTKSLTILTIAMLVLNIVLLGVIFFDGDEHHHRRRAGDRREGDRREHFERRMSRHLGLDDAQKEAYEKLHNTHKKEFWQLSKAIFETKKRISESLAVDQETEARKLLMQLDSLHQVREQKYFDHTQAIFTLFTPEQRQKFLETLDKVGDEHRKKRRRRDD